MGLDRKGLALAAIATLASDLQNHTSSADGGRDEVTDSRSRVVLEDRRTSATPQEVADLIRVVDRTVANLHRSTDLKLQTSDDPALKSVLADLFSYYEANKTENPNRNGVGWWAQPRNPASGAWVQAPSTHAFWIVPNDVYNHDGPEIRGGFADASRVLAASADCDPLDVTCQLTVLHETVHAYQDTKKRDSLEAAALERYLKWKLAPHEAPRAVLDVEVEATLCEVRVLNLLLDGALEREYAAGRTVDVHDIARQLEVPYASLEDLGVTLLYAQTYYGGDTRHPHGEKPSVNFLGDTVAYTHVRQGFELYRWDTAAGDYRPIPIPAAPTR